MSPTTGTFKTPEEIAADRKARAAPVNHPPRNYCGECGDYHRAGEHNPEYAVWRPTRGGNQVDLHLVRATGPSDAAETWAEVQEAQSQGRPILRGAAATVCVRAPDGTVTRWVVSGEAVPRYDAAPVVCPVCKSPGCNPAEGTCADALSNCECPDILAGAEGVATTAPGTP